MATTDLTKPLIAVLEDHEDTRDLWRLSFEQEFCVQDFQKASDLLSALERHRFAAVVADIMMPELDGYDFVKAVRADPRFKNLCIIAVTALAMTSDRQKAMEAGFTDFLVKPITPAEIMAVLWRCIKSL